MKFESDSRIWKDSKREKREKKKDKLEMLKTLLSKNSCLQISLQTYLEIGLHLEKKVSSFRISQKNYLTFIKFSEQHCWQSNQNYYYFFWVHGVLPMKLNSFYLQHTLLLLVILLFSCCIIDLRKTKISGIHVKFHLVIVKHTNFLLCILWCLWYQ